MKQPLAVVGLTLQIRVHDLPAAETWYTLLLGRPPDMTPEGSYRAWELLPMCYLLLTSGRPNPASGRLRLGVADIEVDRERIQDALRIAISPIERVEGVAAWCDFADPYGTPLGLYQDLADRTMLE